MNPYNQVSNLTQDTTWESDKNTINTTNESQEVSPFPAGDHKAAASVSALSTSSFQNHVPRKWDFECQNIW